MTEDQAEWAQIIIAFIICGILIIAIVGGLHHAYLMTVPGHGVSPSAPGEGCGTD